MTQNAYRICINKEKIKLDRSTTGYYIPPRSVLRALTTDDVDDICEMVINTDTFEDGFFFELFGFSLVCEDGNPVFYVNNDKTVVDALHQELHELCVKSMKVFTRDKHINNILSENDQNG